MNSYAAKECNLSVIIPAYNEEERLPLTLKKVYDYLSMRSIAFEIIVVDDGSIDGTAAIAEQFFASRQNGTVIKNRGNQGKGFSVRRGVLQAKGEYILFSDADLSTPIEELEKLARRMADVPCDIAIASRAHRESDVRVAQLWYRKLMGQGFNVFVQLLALPGIRDTQCGFKYFRRGAGLHVFSQQRLTGFGFDVEILYIARKAGYAIQEVPVAWINSTNSRVHLVSDSIRMLFDLGRIRWNELRGRYSTSEKPKKCVELSEARLHPLEELRPSRNPPGGENRSRTMSADSAEP